MIKNMLNQPKQTITPCYTSILEQHSWKGLLTNHPQKESGVPGSLGGGTVKPPVPALSRNEVCNISNIRLQHGHRMILKLYCVVSTAKQKSYTGHVCYLYMTYMKYVLRFTKSALSTIQN